MLEVVPEARAEKGKHKGKKYVDIYEEDKKWLIQLVQLNGLSILEGQILNPEDFLDQPYGYNGIIKYKHEIRSMTSKQLKKLEPVKLSNREYIRWERDLLLSADIATPMHKEFIIDLGDGSAEVWGVEGSLRIIELPKITGFEL
jgi:hypothetical protein